MRMIFYETDFERMFHMLKSRPNFHNDQYQHADSAITVVMVTHHGPARAATMGQYIMVQG